MLENYTRADLKVRFPQEEKNKIEISNECYAVCEFIELLIKKLELLRTR